MVSQHATQEARYHNGTVKLTLVIDRVKLGDDDAINAVRHATVGVVRKRLDGKNSANQRSNHVYKYQKSARRQRTRSNIDSWSMPSLPTSASPTKRTRSGSLLDTSLASARISGSLFCMRPAVSISTQS